MHVAIELPATIDDLGVSTEARRRGLALPALSTHFLGPPRRGLLVHYGNAPVPDITRGVRALGELIGDRG